MSEDRGFKPVFHLHAAFGPAKLKIPPAWLEIGRFLVEVGVPSVWPARSYCAQLHGAIPSGIRWGAGAFSCSAPAAPSAQGKQPGSSWCWRGRIFRGQRIFAVHFCSAAAPGFEEQSRVLRIGVGWSGSTTDCAGGREFHHCFGAVGAVSSSAGRDACRCAGGEFNKSVVCRLVVLPSRRAV